jgi:hypothetical protein
MDQNNPNNGGFNTGGGFNTTSASDRPGTTTGSTGSSFGTGSTGSMGSTGTGSSVGTTSATETCAHCGQSLGQNRGLEQFLGRIGISDDMINNLKTQMQNVDVEEYLNTARDYLRGAGEKVKNGSDKATQFAKDNPAKVAAGVAVLAVGAGLLINSLRDKD